MTDAPSPPAMTSQPYPLFAAVITTCKNINYGRVIGWVNNCCTCDDSQYQWMPVIAYQGENGGPIYHTAALVEGEDLFLSEDLTGAVSRAQARLAILLRNTPAPRD
ncbi:hypothetical protein [Micromonospora wenchangensis]|uniref:hypothetical protein n=1 Tax=Micromonospora wenchangensis TaxID=1185415 RepID=UPI00381460BE